MTKKDKIAYVRLDKKSQEILDKKVSEIGLSQSSVIRMIILEWAEMKKDYITIPVRGYVDDADIVKYKNNDVA
jgi:antitoxin component of RelBE/YafQ-DinJ toxin-antitoxin module